MVYPLSRSNINKIIDEIVNEGKRKLVLEHTIKDLRECPVCHHVISLDSKYCPYCFEVFDEDVNIEKLTQNLLIKVNEISKIAASRDIYVPNLLENIKNANKNLKNIKNTHKNLQERYLELAHRLSNSILEEERRYKILLSLDPKNKKLFITLERLVDDWNFEKALEGLENIKDRYEKFSKELQLFLEELERVERAVEIAEDFGLDVSKTLEIIDRAKDEADKRDYKKALDILYTAFLPLKSEIEEVMNKTLNIIKSKKDLFINDELGGRKLIRLLQELKFYWAQENLISVIEYLGLITKEF